MKLFRFALNIWITGISVLSFLIGWVALAHSPKPVQHTQATVNNMAPLPTLAPLQNPFGGDGGNNFNFQSPSNSFNNFNGAPAPIFRTGGS